MEKTVVDRLVNRFLSWPVPATVCADPCATMPDYPHQRIGTNLLTFDEARQMVEYLFENEIKESREMERSYTHQLGEMARLCDLVCSHVLNPQGTGTDGRLMPFPDDVKNAAEEIMEYVDAVRPSASEPKAEWAVHIIGPDDVHDCRGEFDALRRANQHNQSWARLMADDPKPNDPYCVAVTVLKETLKA